MIDSDKVKSTFSTSEATQPTELDISNAFSKKQSGVVLKRNLPQQCAVNAGALPVSILGQMHSLVNIYDLPNILCNIAIYADNATLYSNFG